MNSLFKQILFPRPINKIKVFLTMQLHSGSLLKEIVDTTLVQTQKSIDNIDPFSKVGQSEKKFLENLAPPMKKSFNFAAYVNHSPLLQDLITMGVSLFDIENVYYNQGGYLLNLDFKKDCMNHLKFLIDLGIDTKAFGKLITQFPTIFQVPVEELQLRISFLELKGFSKRDIIQILESNAAILSRESHAINYNLEQMMLEFQISDRFISKIVAKHPDVLLLPRDQYRLIKTCLIDEFGFESREMKIIVVKSPKIIDTPRQVLIRQLDLVHNTIGLSHEMIVKFPDILTGPSVEITNRFLYLKSLKRNQFDPTKPLYVPPSALHDIEDDEFLSKYCRTDFDNFNKFLKSL